MSSSLICALSVLVVMLRVEDKRPGIRLLPTLAGQVKKNPQFPDKLLSYENVTLHQMPLKAGRKSFSDMFWYAMSSNGHSSGSRIGGTSPHVTFSFRHRHRHPAWRRPNIAIVVGSGTVQNARNVGGLSASS